MKWTLLFLVLACGVACRAEDWTTTDGKTYKDVKVLKVEPDAVTIMHSDGGALVPLATLPPTLQTRFKYDPAKAHAASTARAKADQKDIEALQAEKDRQNAQNITATQIAAKDNADPKKNGIANGSMSTTNSASGGPPWKPGAVVDPATHVDHSQRDTDDKDSRTHYSGI